MPGNTFEFAKTPDGKTAIHCGTLHMLNEGDRKTAWELNDTTITTDWEECDLSARVPPGTTAIYGYLQFSSGDAGSILNIRDGAGTEADTVRTMSFRQVDASAGMWMGCPVIIKATNGIFDYREYDATFEVATINFLLWGYFI